MKRLISMLIGITTAIIGWCADSQKITTLAVDCQGDMQLLIGTPKPVGLIATFEDGHTEDVSSSATYTWGWEGLLEIASGKITGLRDGKTDVTATYTDPQGSTKTTTFTVSSSYFPFDPQYINCNIWETGTYYPETRGFKPGQWGQMGWVYDQGVNMSKYKYLVLTLDEVQNCDADIRLYAQKSIWGGSSFIRKFGSSTRIVLDLHSINYTDGDEKGEPVPINNIYMVVFWSNGSGVIDVNDMYLTSRADYERENGSESEDEIIETALTSGKTMTGNNPISPFNFCADPTALVYEGRMYVYGTNDHQQFEINGYEGGNDYGLINSLVCMSSADMVNWTWHAPIDVKAVAPWTGCSWAPSACCKKGADGKMHFYMYFANGGSGIGVLTADSPTGPWRDPLGKVFIGHGHPGMGQVVWLFDPGVVVDQNGTGWLSWGGGDRPTDTGNKLIDGNTRIAKLGDDMISFDSEIKILPAPYHFEASELNVIGGKYVYTYCSNWDSDRSQWKDFEYYDHSQAKPSAPGGAQMCYMTTTTPLDPESWEYVGAYLDHPGGNNHTHLQKMGEDYYLLYHSEKLARALNGDGRGYRSISVDPIKVDEANCRIPKITMTNAGPAQRGKAPIITELQQAEMMWNAASINVRTSGDNSWVVPKQAGAWVAVKQVFAYDAVHSVKVSLRGKGRLEIRLNNVNADAIATIDFDSSKFEDYTAQLTQGFEGQSNIYFVFTQVEGADTAFDNWQFFYTNDAGVSLPEATASVAKQEYYNLSGVRLERAPKGIYIVRTTYTDGTVRAEKRSTR